MMSSTSIPETMPVPAAMPAGRLRMPIPTMPGTTKASNSYSIASMENKMKNMKIPCISLHIIAYPCIPSDVVRNMVQIFSFSETISEVGDR